MAQEIPSNRKASMNLCLFGMFAAMVSMMLFGFRVFIGVPIPWWGVVAPIGSVYAVLAWAIFEDFMSSRRK